VKANILGFNGFVLSVAGDVPVEARYPMTSSILYRGFGGLSLKVLIRVGLRAYVDQGESVDTKLGHTLDKELDRSM
jgi:hypothetical protein